MNVAFDRINVGVQTIALSTEMEMRDGLGQATIKWMRLI